MQSRQSGEDMVEHLLMQVLQILGIDGYSRYSTIISKALKLYMEFSSRYRIKSRRIMAYTAIYVALRLEGYAMTVNAFADKVGVDAKRLASCYRAVQRVLGLTIPNPALHAYIDELVRWIEYGVNDRYGNNNVDTVRLKAEACRLADDVVRSIMNGKGVNPVGVAAAILYLSLVDGERRAVSIKDLASISGVSMATISKRVEELRPFLKVCLTIE
ncbi:MAG: hypothetical protein QXW26_05755 [Candidatus Nitrosocaldus sp.]